MKPKKSLVGNSYRQLQDKFDTRYLKKSSSAKIVAAVNMKPTPIPIIGGGGSYNNPSDNPLDVVTSIESLIGDITFSSADKSVTITNDGKQNIDFAAAGGSGGVESLSTDGGKTELDGKLKLTASTNIKITDNGTDEITIECTAAGGAHKIADAINHTDWKGTLTKGKEAAIYANSNQEVIQMDQAAPTAKPKASTHMGYFGANSVSGFNLYEPSADDISIDVAAMTGFLKGLKDPYLEQVCANYDAHVQPVILGGTGVITWAVGDIPYASSKDVLGSLTVGTENQVVTAKKVGGTLYPQYADIPSQWVTGMIIMWSGTIATIPTGWVLCDGNNSTPDLRERFIVGASVDDGGVAKTTITTGKTQTGGAIDHTHGNHTVTQPVVGDHTVTQPVIKNHVVTQPAFNTHEFTPKGTVNNSSATGVAAGTGTLAAPRVHSHTFTGTKDTTSLTHVRGTDAAVDAHSLSTNVAVDKHGLSTNVAVDAHDTSRNLVPYFALAFIMKT